MPKDKREKTRDRLFSELATLHPEDAAEILQGLARDERRMIENLLDSLGRPLRNSFAQVLNAGSGDEPGFDGSRISPWLLERLENNSCGSLAPKARAELTACATKLFPAATSSAKLKHARRNSSAAWKRRKDAANP